MATNSTIRNTVMVFKNTHCYSMGMVCNMEECKIPSVDLQKSLKLSLNGELNDEIHV